MFRKTKRDSGNVVLPGEGEEFAVNKILALRTRSTDTRSKGESRGRATSSAALAIALLLAANHQWVSIQPSWDAARCLAEIEADLDQTHFAWTGANLVNTPAYVIMQGPTLIIELLSTGGRVRSGRGLCHTIYRGPTMEHGGLEM